MAGWVGYAICTSFMIFFFDRFIFRFVFCDECIEDVGF